MKFYPFFKSFPVLLVRTNLSLLAADCELPFQKPFFPYLSVAIPILKGEVTIYAHLKDYISISQSLSYSKNVTKF